MTDRPDLLTVEQIEEMARTIERRQTRFDEDRMTSLAVVLLNSGDQFAVASCAGGEWTGPKADLPRTEGIPKCPSGHVLMQGPGKVLAWVDDPVFAEFGLGVSDD